MTVGIWGLYRRVSDGVTVLRNSTFDGATVTDGPDIECPDLLTLVSGTSGGPSTCVLRSWPQDRRIVYFAGRSDTDGHMKCWRYNDHEGTFELLLDENPSSGTWPFATGMWLSRTGDERAWLVTGNGSAWSIFANQNNDGAQSVWYSTLGGSFTDIGPGHGLAYAGSNINHPNSLQDIFVDEANDDDLYVTHSVTWNGLGSPNTFPYWQSVDLTEDGGATWIPIPHPTGMQFIGGWVNLWSEIEGGNYQVMNGSGTGAYAFPNTNFGTTWSAGAPTATGLGAYEENSACLVFPDQDNFLLAFHTQNGTIDRHDPRTGSIDISITDLNWGAFCPTTVRVATSGGAAIGINLNKFDLCYLFVTEDYGANWHVAEEGDFDGLAIDFGPESVADRQVYEEVLTWRDSRNFTGHSRYYVLGDDPAEARNNAAQIASTFVEVSDAQFELGIGPWTTFPTAPTRGNDEAYNNIEMVGRFTWMTADGVAVGVDVPCPIYFMFLSNQEVLSLLETRLNDVADAGITYRLCTRGGLPVTKFVGLTRIMRGFRTRQTIRTLDPSETLPSE